MKLSSVGVLGSALFLFASIPAESQAQTPAASAGIASPLTGDSYVAPIPPGYRNVTLTSQNQYVQLTGTPNSYVDVDWNMYIDFDDGSALAQNSSSGTEVEIPYTGVWQLNAGGYGGSASLTGSQNLTVGSHTAYAYSDIDILSGSGGSALALANTYFSVVAQT